MDYLLKTGTPESLKTACLVVGVYTKKNLTEAADSIDQAANGLIRKVLAKGDFQGAPDQTLMLYETEGLACDRVLLVGLGEQKAFNRSALRKASSLVARTLQESHVIEAVSTLPATPVEDLSNYRIISDIIVAGEESLYSFNQCKSESTPPKRPLKKMGLYLGTQRKRRNLEQAISHAQAIAAGISLAKTLGNLPGNICTPGYLADQARALGRAHAKLKVQVLEERRMKSLGMGALLSVSRGSRQPAKLIVMEYNGGTAKSKPVVLVGKGLTFDAGGISLKPADSMDEMKYDMCGGASVLGVIKACIEANLPINVVGVVPASENLPDGDANKPGDIVTSMSGQTIEVLNTDAEGRLILCDALTFSKRFNPDVVIDIATLTGACVVALGNQATGLLSNNDKLADDLLSAGTSASDRAWRLPLWDEYQSQLDSNFADMANIGGKGAGTITAGCFLARFTKEYKWAHLDIAGTAWNSGQNKGGTGRPVALLTQYLLKRCKLDG